MNSNKPIQSYEKEISMLKKYKHAQQHKARNLIIMKAMSQRKVKKQTKSGYILESIGWANNCDAPFKDVFFNDQTSRESIHWVFAEIYINN